MKIRIYDGEKSWEVEFVARDGRVVRTASYEDVYVEFANGYENSLAFMFAEFSEHMMNKMAGRRCK